MRVGAFLGYTISFTAMQRRLAEQLLLEDAKQAEYRKLEKLFGFVISNEEDKRRLMAGEFKGLIKLV